MAKWHFLLLDSTTGCQSSSFKSVLHISTHLIFSYKSNTKNVKIQNNPGSPYPILPKLDLMCFCEVIGFFGMPRGPGRDTHRYECMHTPHGDGVCYLSQTRSTEERD